MALYRAKKEATPSHTSNTLPAWHPEHPNHHHSRSIILQEPQHHLRQQLGHWLASTTLLQLLQLLQQPPLVVLLLLVVGPAELHSPGRGRPTNTGPSQPHGGLLPGTPLLDSCSWCSLSTFSSSVLSLPRCCWLVPGAQTQPQLPPATLPSPSHTCSSIMHTAALPTAAGANVTDWGLACCCGLQPPLASSSSARRVGRQLQRPLQFSHPSQLLLQQQFQLLCNPTATNSRSSSATISSSGSCCCHSTTLLHPLWQQLLQQLAG